MMCALDVNAQEAYAWYSPATNSLTFYYDSDRSSRTGTTYDLNTATTDPAWVTDGTYANVKQVSFDPSFADARPTKTDHWFYEMKNLESITGLEHLNTSQVMRMDYMFTRCYKLTSLDLNLFNTSAVTDMSEMFRGCSALQTIYVGDGWKISNMAQSISKNVFKDCFNLKGGKGTAYDAAHVDADYAHIDGGTDNPGYLSAGTMPYVCYTPENTTITFYYDNQRDSRTGRIYDLNTESERPSWELDKTCREVTNTVIDPSFADARPTSTYGWFYEMKNIDTIIGLEYLNTSEVTSMYAMFGDCEKLKTLDLSNWNTAAVTNMVFMFSFCLELQTIYVSSGWNTDCVTESEDMFSNNFNLVGGQGTTYSRDHTDKAYAHIDGGTDNPGYFTRPEAYAVYTNENLTLTFYCDNQRSSREGTTFDLNKGDNQPSWYADAHSTETTHVVFDPSFAEARPTSTLGWFAWMVNLQSFAGLQYLNTSEVNNMAYMFNGCQKLTSLDLSTFNTAKVTDMEGMFKGCTNLTTIYVGEGWSTDAVTESGNMFTNSTKLMGGMGTTYDANHVEADYAHIDGGMSTPGYLTDPNAPVAYACYTPENTTLTFYRDFNRNNREGTAYNLNEEDKLPAWVDDETYTHVTQVVFDPSFAEARPTTTNNWFFGMQNLESITGLENLNTSQVTDMAWMFYNCTKQSIVDLSTFNTEKVTNMLYMFSGCSGLTSLDLSSFNTSFVTNMESMFNDCTNLQTIYVGNGWNTDAVTQSVDMFHNCTSLVGGKGTVVDWYTDKTYARIDGGSDAPGYLTDKNAPMAYACYTSNNTTLTFYYDLNRSNREGTTYNLNGGEIEPGWYNDQNSGKVSHVVFDPSFAEARPTSTYGWFHMMANLQTITGLLYLNTSEVTNMNYMFYNCQKLTRIDMSGFNTSKVTDMGFMFRGCTHLTTIYVSDGWSTDAVERSDEMFTNCTKLVGGLGTTYDEEHIDKAYAHLDGGPDNPGYFTEKPAFIRGDVNDDGEVNIADVVALVNMILNDAPFSDKADVNNDGGIDISDAVALVNIILGQ